MQNIYSETICRTRQGPLLPKRIRRTIHLNDVEIECVINTTVGSRFYKYVVFITRVNLLKMKNLLQNYIVHTMLVVAEYPLCLNTDFHLFRIYINKKRT